MKSKPSREKQLLIDAVKDGRLSRDQGIRLLISSGMTEAAAREEIRRFVV